jgi:hypothetical protein
MAVMVAVAVTSGAVAIAAVVAAVAVAVVGSSVSGIGNISGFGSGVTVMPVAYHPFAAPTAHLEIESCSITQGAFFTHALEQLICFSCPICIWLGNYKTQ